MAEQSPAKKSKTVQGYICDVSPLKDPEKPYFEAILQHQSERANVVAFRPEDHVPFQNAEKTRRQVVLENVVISPSKTKGPTNVYYTHNSNMSCVRDLGHAFKNTLPDEAHDIKLSELLKLDLKPKKVNINVKIILEEFKGNNFVWDKRYLPNTVYTVADSTGYISLTVWCNKNITIGEWYKFTNVSVRQFGGKTTFQSTKQTNILNIPSQGTAVDVEVPIESLKCDIIGVKMNILFICPGKHVLKDPMLSSSSVYCALCETLYKTTAIMMKVRGHLNLKPETGDNIKARVEDEVIRSVVDVKPDASQNDIVQALMALPPMQITICKNVIVKMEESSSHTLSPGMESQTSPSVMEPANSIDFSPSDLGIFSSQPQKRKYTD